MLRRPPAGDDGMTMEETLIAVLLSALVMAIVVTLLVLLMSLRASTAAGDARAAGAAARELALSAGRAEAPLRCASPVDTGGAPTMKLSECAVLDPAWDFPRPWEPPVRIGPDQDPLCWVTIGPAAPGEDSRDLECWHFLSSGVLAVSVFDSLPSGDSAAVVSEAADRINPEFGAGLLLTTKTAAVGVLPLAQIEPPPARMSAWECQPPGAGTAAWGPCEPYLGAAGEGAEAANVRGVFCVVPTYEQLQERGGYRPGMANCDDAAPVVVPVGRA